MSDVLDYGSGGPATLSPGQSSGPPSLDQTFGSGPFASGGGSSPTGYGQMQLADPYAAIDAQRAESAAQQAYLEERLRTYELPMLDVEKDRLAFQKAAQAYQNALTNSNQQGTQTGMYSAITGMTADPNAPGGFTVQYGTPQQTLAMTGLMGYDASGKATLGEQQLQQQTALSALDLLGKLQSDPFAMERVARGMTSTGIPNSIANLSSGRLQPLFQGNQAQPVPPSLGSLSGLLGIAATPQQGMPTAQTTQSATQDGGLPFRTVDGSPDTMAGANNSAGSGSASSGTDPISGMNTQGTLDNLIAPNKLNAVDFNQLSQPGQNFDLSAYKAAGYNPADVEATLKGELPQFAAPRYGDVSA